MDKFLIKGGNAAARHGGDQRRQEFGAAGDDRRTCSRPEKVTLHNIPKVRDLITMSKLLAFMSAKVSVTEMPASDYVIEAVTLERCGRSV